MAGDEDDETPWEDVGSDEQCESQDKEVEKYGRGQNFVGKVRGRGYESDERIVNVAEIGHGILKVAHIAEKVF